MSVSHQELDLSPMEKPEVPVRGNSALAGDNAGNPFPFSQTQSPSIIILAPGLTSCTHILSPRPSHPISSQTLYLVFNDDPVLLGGKWRLPGYSDTAVAITPQGHSHSLRGATGG